MQKIKKGDNVVVLAGKDKGRTGEVVKVMPKEDKALVRGVNLVRRHQKQSAQAEGRYHYEGSANPPVEPGAGRPEGWQADPCWLQGPGRRQEGARGEALWRIDRWLMLSTSRAGRRSMMR